MLLPVERAREFFRSLQLPRPLDEATELLLGEIRARFSYLGDVGLGYLTLDRQSRTLSGGEVQRINLTTALGTSLVNTLFVLDEPSHRPASARHERVIERDEAAARCRQHAGRGRARPADHAGGRPHPRHGPGRRRARRRDRVLRHARRDPRAAAPRSPASTSAAASASPARGRRRAARAADAERRRARMRAPTAGSSCAARASTT